MTTTRHTRPGPVHLDLSTSFGTVEVYTEDREHAEITLSPEHETDETALDLIARAQITSHANEFSVRMPRPAAAAGGMTVVQSGRGVSINSVSAGNIVIGSAGGTVVVNGRVISGSGTTVVTMGVVRVVARLPLGSSLTADAGSATVTSRGHLKAIRFSATSGDLRADSAGSVNARTQSGDVEIRAMDSGMLKAMSGDITIDGLAGSASVSTTSGDIRVIVGDEAELDADSLSGDVTVTGGAGRVSARSMSGRVRTPRAVR